ncbi:MAG: hypothetical protein LAO20_03550 [Acidobacteriia bacterium]|nr:hypothetical protein [Terriglobia bacterium]
MKLEEVSRRDIIVSVMAAVAGLVVSFLPHYGPDLNAPNTNNWIRAYERIGLYIFQLPWNLILVSLLIFLLFRAKFRRGGWGVAFCLGIIIGKTLSHLAR